MLDIGFFELILIALVGLFVIGPERLPGTIKTGMLWFGRIKRNLLDTRRELEKHIGADEIRRELQNEQVMHNLAKMKDTRDELAKKIQNWQDDTDTEEEHASETYDGADDTPKDEEDENDAYDENDPYGDNLHHDESTTDSTTDDGPPRKSDS